MGIKMYMNQGKNNFITWYRDRKKEIRSSMLLLNARISAGVQNNTFANKIHISNTKKSPKLTSFFLQSNNSFG